MHTKSVAKMKNKIRELTDRNNGMSNAKREEKYQQFVRGWVNYFKLADMKNLLKDTDEWARRRIRAEDLMTETLQYFGTILAGTTITIFNNFAMTLLRSVGNSRVPLVAMIISAIANVLMDLLFVFPLHMGVFGAALATVLAQVLSALYCCY